MQTIDPTIVAAVIGVGGTLVGTLIGYYLSLSAQQRASELEEEITARKEVYAPLRDELARIMASLAQSVLPQVSEWTAINAKHLTYLIDSEREEMIEHFYGTTLYTLRNMYSALHKHLGGIIRKDLLSRVNVDTGDLQNVIYAISFAIQRGHLTEYDLPTYSHNYEKLKSMKDSSIEGTLTDYFEYWKPKFKDDPYLIEFHSIGETALQRSTDSVADDFREIG